jgi:hypothetical protein
MSSADLVQGVVGRIELNLISDVMGDEALTKVTRLPLRKWCFPAHCSADCFFLLDYFLASGIKSARLVSKLTFRALNYLETAKLGAELSNRFST